MEEADLHTIAAAYQLEPEEVLVDVGVAAQWTGTADDLLAALEHWHAWDAGRTATYLMAFRRASG